MHHLVYQYLRSKDKDKGEDGEHSSLRRGRAIVPLSFSISSKTKTKTKTKKGGLRRGRGRAIAPLSFSTLLNFLITVATTVQHFIIIEPYKCTMQQFKTKPFQFLAKLNLAAMMEQQSKRRKCETSKNRQRGPPPRHFTLGRQFIFSFVLL